MLVISEAEAAALVSFDEVEEAVRSAFIALERGQGLLFEVMNCRGVQPADFFALKAGCYFVTRTFGLKVGSYCPGNADRGSPAHTSTVMLFDASSGAPLALVGAGRLNGMRTAAASALAARALAREGVRTLGVIGLGHQAVFEAWAMCRARPITRILCHSPSGRGFETFARDVAMRTGVWPELAACEDVVRQSEILVTATPSRAALVRSEWVNPGTHVSAIGADAQGKQELDVDLVRRSRVVVDVPAQAATIGECQHAIAAGILSSEELPSLGALLLDPSIGRRDEREITLFDSSGMALQDVAVAHSVYRLALSKGGFTSVVVSGLESSHALR